MSITVESKLHDRCADMVSSMRDQLPIGGLIDSALFGKIAEDLHAFVLAEIGRAANEKLADSSALVLFFSSPEGADEVAKAIQGAMPGLVERKWP